MKGKLGNLLLTPLCNLVYDFDTVKHFFFLFFQVTIFLRRKKEALIAQIYANHLVLML